MDLWREQFSSGPLAVRAARSVVRERLSGALPDRRLDDVELLISELATNSVRHAGAGAKSQLAVEAALWDDCVQLRMCDEGTGFEEPETPTPHADGEGGYGLVLLDRLSDRWGVKRNGGFCVWFDIARTA